MTRPLRVFLCHSSNDKPTVRELYQKLRAEAWIQPWLDEEELYPGQDWNMEIEKAVEAADAIIVCLTKGSITKEGYVQRELRTVLDFADYKPEGTLYIIPVRLEECEPPRRLRAWQYADYFEGQRERAFQRLLVSLKRRADALGLITEEIREELKKEIPAKPFTKLLEPSSLLRNGPADSQSRKLDERAPSLENQESPLSNKRNLDLSILIPQALFSLFILALLTWGIYTMLSSKTPKQSANLPVTATAVSLPIATTTTESLALTSVPFTSTPQPTGTPIPTPTLGIGSTMISEKDGMVVVYVPASAFLMGSTDADPLVSYIEKPQHTVYLDAFWIDQTEVTNAMYAKCVSDGACRKPTNTSSSTHPSYYGTAEFDNYPVIYVDWNMANGYCSWAGRRLPTEAEWEKAARGENPFVYPWGNDAPNKDLLNYNQNIGDVTVVKNYSNTVSFYGTYDMAGNVWEWVNDWYGETYYESSNSSNNPLGPESGQNRVLRGGSWLNDYGFRSAARNGNVPTFGDFNIGFRCSRSP